MSPLAPASSLMPGQKSLSFRRQLQLLPGRSEGCVSADADPDRGSGLGGDMDVIGAVPGASEPAPDALGAGGGIVEHPEAPPSWLRFPPGFEGLGWEN